MSDVETELRDLLHDSVSWAEGSQMPYPDRLAGARRYALRVRRTRMVTAAALAAAVVAAGGAVASGAFRDRTLAPANPAPTTPARSLPPGPSWKDTVQLKDAQGRTVTLTFGAVVAKPGSVGPDPRDPSKRLFTTPTLAGWYTLTSQAPAPRDVIAPAAFAAYWKVPAGFCTRYDQYISEGGWPVPKVAGGQELCPLAIGDSTLPSTPQTLDPKKPLLLRIEATTINPAPNAPLPLSPADAATAVRLTATPPVGWLALDDDFATGSDSRVASSGMPPG